MNIVLGHDAFLDGVDERAGVVHDPLAEVGDVLRALDGGRVEFVLFGVILAHRGDVCAVLEEFAVEDRFGCTRRGDHHVRTLDRGVARRHGRDRGVELFVHLGGEFLPVLRGRRVDVHRLEAPNGRTGPKLTAGLGTAPDDRERRRVRSRERVDADRTRRAGLERVDARAVEQGDQGPRLGVEHRLDELGVAVAEARGVHVATHRARLGQDGGVVREHARRLLVREFRPRRGRRALAALAVALAHRPDVLLGRREPRTLLAGQKQRSVVGHTGTRASEAL